MRRFFYSLLGLCVAGGIYLFTVIQFEEYSELYKCVGRQTIKLSGGDQIRETNGLLRLRFHRWFIFLAWGDKWGDAHFETSGWSQYYEKIDKATAAIHIYSRDYSQMRNGKPTDAMHGLLSSLSGELRIMYPPSYFFDGSCMRHTI